MTSQTITIPTQPLANQPFTIHYNNPTYVPTYSTTVNTNFVLKDTNGNTVSSTFVNPTYGISILGSHNPPPASCSTLIHDSQYNYYYTNSILPSALQSVSICSIMIKKKTKMEKYFIFFSCFECKNFLTDHFAAQLWKTRPKDDYHLKRTEKNFNI